MVAFLTDEEKKVETKYNFATLMRRFDGHCYLIRRCLLGDKVEGYEGERKLGGIVLPYFCDGMSHECDAADVGLNPVTNPNLWGVVALLGPRVGKPCSKKHAREFCRACWYGDYARKDDMVLVNHSGRGIEVKAELGYCFGESEDDSWVLVEESKVMAIWRDDE